MEVEVEVGVELVKAGAGKPLGILPGRAQPCSCKLIKVQAPNNIVRALARMGVQRVPPLLLEQLRLTPIDLAVDVVIPTTVPVGPVVASCLHQPWPQFCLVCSRDRG